MAVEVATIIRGNNLGLNQAGLQVNEIKQAVFMLDNTANATDTYAITLADHGITTFWGFLAYKETTDGSVIVSEAFTTAVAAGVLTMTVPAGTNTDPRTLIIFGV